MSDFVFDNYTKYSLSKSIHGGYRLLLYADNYPDDINRSCGHPNWSTIDSFLDERMRDDPNYVRDYDLESVNRARRTLLDLSLNNNFDWFITFTFDRKKIDRYDIANCKTKFLKAISNYQRKFNSKINYIAVPEFHNEDSNAIHFHCLMSGLADLKFLKLDSKTGYKVFRSDYFFKKFGAVYAVRIFDYNKFVAYYVFKYITKSSDSIFYQRYFRSSGLAFSENISSGFCSSSLPSFFVPSVSHSLYQIYEFDNLCSIPSSFWGGVLCK